MPDEPFSRSRSNQERLRIGIFGFQTLDRDLVEDTITLAGWAFTFSSSIEPAWDLWSRLDLSVLGPSNIESEFLAFITDAWASTGVPMLVIAEANSAGVVASVLRAGASDYMPAPFAPEELEARIRVLTLRKRVEGDRKPGMRLGLDHVTRTVHAGAMHVSLSPREWSALMTLLDAESQLVTVDDLSEALTGAAGHETIVISTISRLRKKLHAHHFVPLSIQTVYGQGYVARWRQTENPSQQHGGYGMR